MDVVASVFSLFKVIHDTVQGVDANREACQFLVDRLGVIEGALTRLDLQSNTSSLTALSAAISNLAVVLQAAHKLISDAGQQGSVYLFLRSGHYAEKFHSVHQLIDRCERDFAVPQQAVHAEDVNRMMSLAHMNQQELMAVVQAESEEDTAGILKQLSEMAALLSSGQTTVGTAGSSTCKYPWELKWEDIEFKRNAEHQRKEIGSGGYAKVYAATYQGRDVAVKVFTKNDIVGILPAFKAEVTLCTRLCHPGIIDVVGATLKNLRDRDDESEYSIVMGRGDLTLRDAIAEGEAYFEEGLRQKLDLLCRLSEALMYIHRRRIIHRDIKCENVVLSSDGSPKLIDFGLATAKATTMATRASSSTPSAAPLGYTEQYAAPEVLNSRVPSDDPKQDIYAFGCLMFELLAEKMCWGPEDDVNTTVADNRDLHQHFALPEAVGCPPSLQELIQMCTQFEPSKRPNAQQVFLAVLACETSESAGSPAVAPAVAPPLCVFDTAVDDLFLCPICFELMQPATNLSPCNHKICGKCVEDGDFKSGSSCPLCRVSLTSVAKDHVFTDAVLKEVQDPHVRCRRCRQRVLQSNSQCHVCAPGVVPPPPDRPLAPMRTTASSFAESPPPAAAATPTLPPPPYASSSGTPSQQRPLSALSSHYSCTLLALFSHPPPSWVSGAPLTSWEGITLNADGEVTEVCLATQKLTGTVQLEHLASLGSLRTMDLSSNQLSGTVKLTKLPVSLNQLFLNSNQFSGTVDLTMLPPFLVELNLSSNQLSGGADLTKLPDSLTVLNLDSNQFSGTKVPPSSTYLHLDSYQLDSNQLTGSSGRYVEGNAALLEENKDEQERKKICWVIIILIVTLMFAAVAIIGGFMS